MEWKNIKLGGTRAAAGSGGMAAAATTAKDAGEFVSALGSGSFGMDDVLQMSFLKHNMPEKIARLKAGLDEASKQTIDHWLRRAVLLPDDRVRENYRIKKSFLESLMTERDREWGARYFRELPQYRKDFQLLFNKAWWPDSFLIHESDYWPSAFLFHHGLRLPVVDDKLKAYIDGKDFIDGGSYRGETALMLSKYYNPRRIFSFDISPKNASLYRENMWRNPELAKKCQLIMMGLGREKGTLAFADTNCVSTTVLQNGDDTAVMTDLDGFVAENNLNVGFIKTDLEGFGLEALAGMRETIIKHRPILSLAIYHNFDEFFETLPALREIVGETYTIAVAQLHPFYDINCEVAIIACPKLEST